MKCNKYVRLSTQFLKKRCPKTCMGTVRPDGSVPRHPGADQPRRFTGNAAGTAHRPPTERTCPGPELPGRIATTAPEMSGLRVASPLFTQPAHRLPALEHCAGERLRPRPPAPSASGPHAPTSRPLPLSSSQSPCNAHGQATQKRGAAAQAGVTRAVLTCQTLPATASEVDSSRQRSARRS